MRNSNAVNCFLRGFLSVLKDYMMMLKERKIKGAFPILFGVADGKMTKVCNKITKNIRKQTRELFLPNICVDAMRCY
jgi:hypothetical protein